MKLDRRKRQGVALIEWWFGGILKVPGRAVRSGSKEISEISGRVSYRVV